MRSFELELRNNPRVISNSNMTRSPLEEQTQPDADSNRELLSMLHDFQPMTCADRWNQEARMLYGTSVPDKSQNLLNPLLNILVPIVMEEERRMREKEEQRREEQRRLQEERRKKEEEERRRHEEEERKRKEHDDAYDSEQQSATTTANGSGMDTSASIQEQDQHRRMITINGELVDISQTGLDVEFLEALPDDLRREVVNDHMRISRSRMQATETESIALNFLALYHQRYVMKYSNKKHLVVSDVKGNNNRNSSKQIRHYQHKCSMAMHQVHLAYQIHHHVVSAYQMNSNVLLLNLAEMITMALEKMPTNRKTTHDKMPSSL